jgi:hypothetical protein
MSELKIEQFRERAERGLDLPDLAELDRRGRRLRRRRTATAVGALALAVVAGFGIAASTGGRDDASPTPAKSPSPTRTTTWYDSLRMKDSLGEGVLLAGPQKLSYDGLSLTFDAPSDHWEWFESGMGLRWNGYMRDEYGAAVFFFPDVGLRLAPCSSRRFAALGADPSRLVANVAPLRRLARARVLQAPRVVRAFGTTAVHLRLETDGGCPTASGIPYQLRSVVGGVEIAPGWGGKATLDLWHVLTPGPGPASMLVASWDLDPEGHHRAEAQALLDSVRIGDR